MGYNFNDQQLEAINSTDRTVLCLAAAGCGKTRTLIARTLRLVNEGVDPTSILCLTFTNAAAFEMKDRYKKDPSANLSLPAPEFRTFHGFCYSLIVKDKQVREKLGYSKIPELCDDSTMKELRTKVKLQIGCTLPDSVLDTECPLSKKDQEMKALFQKALVKQLKKENLITFDIMCYNVCEMFIQDMDCVQTYKQKYTHMLVDEMQDCDPVQFRFISSFPDTTNFFLVGDILQGIYQFRGCTNEFIKQLVKAPGWKVIKMFENYRSTQEICDYANNFSRYSRDDFRIVMHGQRSSGEKPEVIYGSNSTYSSPVDEDHLRILTDKLKQNKNQSAVLCRSNKECAAVREYLREQGVDFSSTSKPKDVISYLDAAMNNDYMLEWLSSLLETKDYGDYLRISSIRSDVDVKWFLTNYSRIEKIKSAAAKVIQVREIATSDIHPQDKFDKITKLLRVKSKCKFEGDEFTTAQQIINSIRTQLEEQQESSLYIGTIHSVKGLEYDTVYVMGVNDRLFNLDCEEMNNLAYVAFTRAKNHLVIFKR